jgi:hypothetical protein
MLVVLAEHASNWAVPTILEAIGMAAICGLTFMINLKLFEPYLTLFAPSVIQQSGGLNDEYEVDPVISQLKVLMEDERLYAVHDLKIGDIAIKLNPPEYRLRTLINSTLGY